MVIHSFADAQSAALWATGNARRLPSDVVRAALRKLQMVHAAAVLADLASPPGNRLEALKGDLKGYHSVRINDQWRVVFRWQDGAHEVAVRDYH